MNLISTFLKTQILFFIFSGFFNVSYLFADSEHAKDAQAQAADLLDQGKGDEALALLKQMTEERPEEAPAHMNYGSILFAKARVWFQSGHEQESLPLFKEAETHLKKAAELFDDRDSALKGQSYYLLGDIYSYVYQDSGKAKEFYEAALKSYPGHDGAKKELERFSAPQT